MIYFYTRKCTHIENIALIDIKIRATFGLYFVSLKHANKSKP